MFTDNNDASDGLSKSDKAIVDGFWEKVKPLREVSAPIADKEFNSKLKEHQSALYAVLGELRVKKKSFNRRVLGVDEQVPLVKSLTSIEDEVKQIQTIIKCHMYEKKNLTKQ